MITTTAAFHEDALLRGPKASERTLVSYFPFFADVDRPDMSDNKSPRCRTLERRVSGERQLRRISSQIVNDIQMWLSRLNELAFATLVSCVSCIPRYVLVF